MRTRTRVAADLADDLGAQEALSASVDALFGDSLENPTGNDTSDCGRDLCEAAGLVRLAVDTRHEKVLERRRKQFE